MSYVLALVDEGRHLDLSDGDRLVVDVVAPRRYGAHPVMNELRMRNGEELIVKYRGTDDICCLTLPSE